MKNDDDEIDDEETTRDNVYIFGRKYNKLYF